MSGTERRLSSAVLMITGRVSTARVRMPDRMLTPMPQKVTKNESPNRPKTTEGTPARLLTPRRTMRAKGVLPAYSCR